MRRGSTIAATSAQVGPAEPAATTATGGAGGRPSASLVDLALDAGTTPGEAPSTIVDARGEAPVLVRAGRRARSSCRGGVCDADRAAGRPGHRRDAAGRRRPIPRRTGRVCDAAGAWWPGARGQERNRPDSATFIGGGKVEALAPACAELPRLGHLRQRAHAGAAAGTEEAVVRASSIARNSSSTSSRARAHARRQAAGGAGAAEVPAAAAGRGSDVLSRLGGGIGTRGPGETKLETDRRAIRARIVTLESEIERGAPAPCSCASGAGGRAFRRSRSSAIRTRGSPRSSTA